MFGVLTDHIYHALALDDLAFWTATLDRWLYFHSHILPFHLIPFHSLSLITLTEGKVPLGQPYTEIDPFESVLTESDSSYDTRTPRPLGTVLGAPLGPTLNPAGVQSTTDDVVADTRQVLDSAPLDEDDGVLL